MEEFEERDLGARSSYKGSLIIVPTPLGNLGDMSLRQFEALTVGCDIIACEDTRKTGKMLQLMKDKRIKSKFRSEFGVDVDQWFDEGRREKQQADSEQQNTTAE